MRHNQKVGTIWSDNLIGEKLTITKLCLRFPDLDIVTKKYDTLIHLTVSGR